jgi:hypothetical protein
MPPLGKTEVAVAADEPADEAEGPSRPASVTALWADVRIDPIEIALPGGVGYTLRAYRPQEEVESADGDREIDLDEFDAASAAVARERRNRVDDEDDAEDLLDESDGDESDDDDADEDADEDEESDGDESDDDDDEDMEEDEEDETVAESEDVPIFLGRNGRVFLFHSPDKLVEFVHSGAENDLSQLDTWTDLVERVTAEDIVPLPEDTYELDLLVENLRGGVDAWDRTMIIKAGEIARDLGHALRIDPVQVALASGSPLDDLDDALRSAEDGGIGGFFAKRKLRKVPTQQSTLAWRTVIGKISAAADWRD